MSYDNLVKALRCKRDDCEGCDLAFFDNDEGWMCRYAAKDDDAAAAIEDMAKHITEMHERVTVLQIARGELEAEVKRLEPKLGEWTEIEDYDGDFHYQCSVCGEEWYFIDGTPADNNANYCPRCGAKMEVQE